MILFHFIQSLFPSDMNGLHRETLSLFAGAACGATIYTLTLKNIGSLRKAGYFLVSLVLGISGAENTMDLLNKGINKFIPGVPDLNKTFSAALAAAIAVRFINLVTQLILSKLSPK